ncbi:disease resistance protein RPV1-like [Vitis riparia]|uniref:disease resistance protein RPV1-like n=1 Tax=Vitis riparia TaxID=96939 RepID=UPI00155AFEBB|nr:disease resistance protein RPV1-like [Vitis riparia]
MASANRPWDYEVFLSFRGEDTRYNFTDHLYSNLETRGIRTFRDDEELSRGEVIAPSLFTAIEKSRCALVILSENYAHSKWCLEELAKIMECSVEMGLIVYPVFYRVDPSDVRNQRGSYGEALAKHERNGLGHQTQRWRAALTEVANLSGWHQQNGSEANTIMKITRTILRRFTEKLLHVDKNLIGMDDRLEEIISQKIDLLSKDVRMIGIYGLGGICKTTIAKVIYNKIATHFMISRFIANVREDSKRPGLLHLQKQLLDDILPIRKNFISNDDEGISMIKDRLRFKKVLLVLDDVDVLDQLEALAGDRKWFGPGSRIIVTTRDWHLLDVHKMDAFYEVKKLNHKEAIELFSQHAFKQKHPKEDYETLSNSMVRCVDGLPLGLKVLGRFLFGKTILEWESKLQKLKHEPKKEIQSVLKRSYDELDHTQKEIFLDIACFFNGEDKDHVTRILDACKFYAPTGIRDLRDKCLINIFDNKISMHDLLQQMGRDMVRQEYPKHPEKWSRLCYPDDVNRVLTKKSGTEAIEGILFDLSIPKRNQIDISTKSFEMMTRLRLLKIYWAHESISMREDNKVKLSKDFEFPASELRYLCWQGYPLESLPSSFYAEDLIELDMCYSSLKQLWESNKPLEKLNTITVSFSQHLMEIPDLSVRAPNLEKLILDGCSSLLEIHPSIGKLSKLILSSLKSCKNLSSFPRIINMEALKILNFSGCSGLKKFPDIPGNMEHLLELYLASTAIEELPSSIGHLTGLVLLDLKRCKNLKSLPESICKLESLEDLFLSGCSKLENFPEMMEDMENLKKLLLDGTSIEGLPLSIDRLKGLVLLNLRNCKNLASLPNSMCNLPSLEKLIVSGCSRLKNLPTNLESLQCLAQLHADGTAVKQLPESIVLLRNLQLLVYPGCKILTPTSLGSLFSFWLLHRNSSNGIGLLLPSGFSSFRSFTNLDLSDCKLIEGAIPNGICSLISLKKLDLSRNNFLSIPASISELTNLKDLRLGQCQSLIEIPELPPSVQDIDAHNCTALLPGSSSVGILQGLQFVFRNCSKPFEDRSSDDKRNALQRFPHNDVSSSASVSSLTTSPVVMQKLLENIAFSIVFPGSGIPEWIWHQNVGSSIKIELPTDWYNDDFLGFALCSVLEHLPERITCTLTSDVFDYGDLKGFGIDFHCKGNNVGLEHVWLGYQPCSQLRLFQFNDPNDWNHIEISFEGAHRFRSSASNVVKKCGVCLIYAEDLEGIHPENKM